MRRYFRILALLILIPVALNAADDRNKCHKSTEGTNFWFGFMETRNYREGHYTDITVTAREATTFAITIGPNETPFNGTYNVGANASVRVTIPWNTVEALNSEIIQDKGIHLVSAKPVNVYALSYSENSSDVAVIYPVESLGSKYFAMCYYPTVSENPNGTYLHGRNSEFLVVSVSDSTEVEITPSVETDMLKPKNVPFKIILQKGQVYQVQSKNRDNTNTRNQGDLTGSKIISNKPIAFYSGSLSTTVPANSCCWDHLYEQIPPVHTWGKEFYTVPLKSRERDRFRILACENNTTVALSNTQLVKLNQGAFYEFELYYNEPTRILADKPVMVAQYSQSQNVDYAYTNGNGDPFMIILSPTTQSKNDVTFVAYESKQIVRYFINIVTPTSEVDNLRLSGAFGNISLQNQFFPSPGGEYSYAQVPLTNGTYRLWNTNPDKGFLAYIYGFGGVESYGYGVGFNLNLVLDLSKNINIDSDTLLLCRGDSVTLDASPYFDTYLWNDSSKNQKLSVKDAGKFWALTTTNDGCVLFDSIFITLSSPETRLGPDINTCPPFSKTLDAGIFESYLWSTGDTVQKLRVDKTGQYSVEVTNQFGCVARDTMKLLIHDVPKISFTGDSLICGKKSTSFSANLSGADPALWNFKNSITWSTDKSVKSKFSPNDSTVTSISVSDWGEYKVNLKVITLDGCQASEQTTLRFFDTPTSKFDFIDDSGDKCKGYNRQVAYTGNASLAGKFYWDFGGCKILDSLGWQKYNISVGAYNSNPYASLFVEENGCKSDTSKMLIGASPDFRLETQKSRGCDTSTIFFTGTLNVPDSLRFEWNFGDGSPVSNLQDVSHFYADTGFYDVGLSITNVLSGCQLGFTIDDFVKVFRTPVASFSANPSACYPDSLKAIYLNAMDSSVCYWQFNGAHLLKNYNDSIWARIDAPTGKIILQVDEFGCLSKPVSKNVKRKPHFDFNCDNQDGCQGRLLETFAIPLDSSLIFTWISDSFPKISSGSNSYLFTKPGKYSLGLTATSLETFCTDTLVKKNWITIHSKPIADFKVDYPVATDKNPTISFTNLSNIGLSFLWDFGDGSSSKSENPKHTYSETGDYLTQLFAQTEYGCLDTAFFTVKIVPFEVFSPNAFRPNSSIPGNRYFMPLATGIDPTKFHIKIYDRWGFLIFESNNPETKWDGKTKNGKDAPMGNYVWMTIFSDLQGFEHKQNGQVLLIR